MKNSIPSDVWETKRALIAKLYKDEEWPLKQVIKQIRTEDFNPSETQLRSRLKKWRVTKPSRQTRKKSQDGQQDNGGDDSGSEEPSPKASHAEASSVTSKTQSAQLTPTEMPAADLEWYNNDRDHSALPSTSPLDDRHATTAWVSGIVPQQALSPQGDHHHLPTSPPMMQQFSNVHAVPSTSYLPGNASSVTNGVMVDTAPVIGPTYASSGYPASPESYLPSPTPTNTAAAAPAVQWPTCTDQVGLGANQALRWYSMPLEAVTQAHSMAFYTTAPMSPSIADYRDPMHSVPEQDSSRIYSSSAPFTSLLHQDMGGFFGELKPWKRAMSVHYNPEAAGGNPRVDRDGRQRKSFSDKRHSNAEPSTSTVNFVPHYSQYLAGGQHPVMCSSVYAYPDQEPLVHKAAGIQF